jgi:hypothetical protein
MSPLAWNIALLVGVCMIGGGTEMAYGLPRALIVVGALVLVLNVVTALVATRGR